MARLTRLVVSLCRRRLVTTFFVIAVVCLLASVIINVFGRPTRSPSLPSENGLLVKQQQQQQQQQLQSSQHAGTNNNSQLAQPHVNAVASSGSAAETKHRNSADKSSPTAVQLLPANSASNQSPTAAAAAVVVGPAISPSSVPHIADSSPSSTSTRPRECDAECSRFRRLLDSWPADKPRAAVVLLVRRQSIKHFEHTAPLFDANFNAAYRYPIVAFHEGDLADGPDRQRFSEAVPEPSRSLLFFQQVAFELPPWINATAVPRKVCFKTVGYRHMCRFQAKTIYDEPILAGLRYVWRMDDDSYILKPVKYDVFRFMRDRQLRYGYAAVVSDYGPCIVGLWPAVNSYLAGRGLRRRFRWPRGRIFWNNFELSDLELWQSPEYRNYVDYIDRLGGIYYRRWGDATIKTIAVTLFTAKSETHHFKDIAYKHGKHVKTKT